MFKQQMPPHHHVGRNLFPTYGFKFQGDSHENVEWEASADPSDYEHQLAAKGLNPAYTTSGVIHIPDPKAAAAGTVADQMVRESVTRWLDQL